MITSNDNTYSSYIYIYIYIYIYNFLNPNQFCWKVRHSPILTLKFSLSHCLCKFNLKVHANSYTRYLFFIYVSHFLILNQLCWRVRHSPILTLKLSPSHCLCKFNLKIYYHLPRYHQVWYYQDGNANLIRRDIDLFNCGKACANTSVNE